MTIGIYCIQHIESGKRYIGKSVNIERRLIQHKSRLQQSNRSLKHTSRHLYNAVQKYGWSAFVTSVIEVFAFVDEEAIAERELYWIDYFNTCDRKCGFNLRRDSSTGMIVSDETREIKSKQNQGVNNPNFGNQWTEDMKQNMSDTKEKQHEDGSIYDHEWKNKLGEKSSKFWKDNPEVKNQMAKKVSAKKQKFDFLQLDEEGNLIRRWGSIEEIISENPSWKWQNIYSVCNGYKKRIYGFKWKKVMKNGKD